jgi:hypothetical protein
MCFFAGLAFFCHLLYINNASGATARESELFLAIAFYFLAAVFYLAWLIKTINKMARKIRLIARETNRLREILDGAREERRLIKE